MNSPSQSTMVVVCPSEQIHRTPCSARIWQLTKTRICCFKKGSPTLEFCLDPKRAVTAPTFVVRVWDHAIPHQIGKNLCMAIDFVRAGRSQQEDQKPTRSKSQLKRPRGKRQEEQLPGQKPRISLEPERSQGGTGQLGITGCP